MSAKESNKLNNSSKTSVKKKSGFFRKAWNFLKEHTKSALMGIVAGGVVCIGMVTGFIGALYIGASMATALIVSGGTSVITGQKVKKILKPKRKFSFYTATALTVFGISAAFNLAVNEDDHAKFMNVKNKNVYSNSITHKKEPVSHKQFKLKARANSIKI